MKKHIAFCNALLIAVILAVCTGAVIVAVLTDSGFVSAYHPTVTPHEGQIRIACVGDSLTYGFGIPDRTHSCYPALLQNDLGDGYCVANFGYSGRTVSPSADRPYTNETLYRESLRYDADIVIIMLGSNDTKPFNWVSDEHYLTQYGKIIDSYMAGNACKRLVLLAPTPVFEHNGKVPYHIVQGTIDRLPTLCAQLYEQLKPLAEEKNITLEFVNLYPLFEGKPDLFSDGAHPTKQGASIIADLLAQHLQNKPVEETQSK